MVILDPGKCRHTIDTECVAGPFDPKCWIPSRLPDLGRKVLDTEDRIVLEKYETLQYIFQFAHVSRPAVGPDEAAGFRSNFAE